MSQFNVGKAHIDLKLEGSDKVKAEINAVKQDLNKLKADAAASGGGDDTGGGRGGPTAINNISRALNRVRLAAIAIPATFVALFAVGSKLREFFNIDGHKLLSAMDKINNTDFSKPQEAIASLTKEIKDLHIILGADFFDRFAMGEIFGDAERRLALFEGALQSARANAENQQRILEENQSKDRQKRLNDLDEEERGLRAGLISDVDKLEAEADAARRKRYKEYLEAVDVEESDRIMRIIELDAEVFRRRIAAATLAADDEARETLEAEFEYRVKQAELAEKAHQEEMDRIREQNEARLEGIRQWERAMRAAMQNQENGFGVGDVTFGGGGGAARTAVWARRGRGNNDF